MLSQYSDNVLMYFHIIHIYSSQNSLNLKNNQKRKHLPFQTKQ